jgi:prepilin-type processing-associated H-X9-DG protein
MISDYTFNNAGGFNMTEDGNGGAIIGWIDGHAEAGHGLLAAQKVNASGALQWPAGGAAVSTASTAFDIGVVNDGNGGAIFSWYDYRNDATTGSDIFAQKLSPGGSLPSLPPTVTTSAISAKTDTTASGGGNVTSDGGDPNTTRGVCWGMSANPVYVLGPGCTSDGAGTGLFTSSITGLLAITSYHVRAYATNSGGTAYGEDISFTTNLCAIDVQRGVGTSYGTIQEAITSGSGPEIKAVARTFQESVSFTNGSGLTFTGGYACGLSSVSGVTSVHGTVTIAGTGGVTVSNVAVY